MFDNFHKTCKNSTTGVYEVSMGQANSVLEIKNMENVYSGNTFA